MSIALIAGIAVIVLIVAIAVKQRSGGPRITTIERKIEEDDKP
ncbi:MAG: hypothetical protein ABIO43_11515 [Sphingomicrobium sp.]